MKLTIATTGLFARYIVIGTFLMLSINLSGQKMTTAFQEVKEIPKGKGVVYVYSMKKKVGYSYRLNVNSIRIKPALFSGGYFVYYSDPGYITLSALKDGKKDSISIGVREGGSYFVEGSLRTGFTGTGAPVLELTDPSSAKKKITKCKLIIEK
jgi:hypothetical protein